MKALKIVGIVILSFLLFVSLSVFGVAFALNSTVLNPRFIPAQVDKLDISALAEEGLSQANQPNMSASVRTVLVAAVDRLEPDIKAQFRRANDRVYDYLLGRTVGRTDEIDLRAVLKDTVLNQEFIASVIDDPGVVALFRDSLRNELVDLIPPDLTLVERLALARYVDQALPSIDPWLRDQARLASGPIVDYLLGESPTLRIVVNLEPIKPTLRASLREAFLRSPPPGIPQAQLSAVFDQVYAQYSAQVPATATIDATSLGIDAPASISQALSDAETGLRDARSAVGMFRAYYVLLIVLMVLLVAGIVLIHREAKGASRDLGIVFLVYGAMHYVGALTGRYFIGSAIRNSDVPAAIQAWLTGLVADSFRRLEMLTLTLAIVGIALVVVSIAYRRTPGTPAVVGSNQQS